MRSLQQMVAKVDQRVGLTMKRIDELVAEVRGLKELGAAQALKTA